MDKRPRKDNDVGLWSDFYAGSKRKGEALQQWHYYYSGLRVASDLMLPEWSHFEVEPGDGDSDVRFILEEAVAEKTEEPSVWLVEPQRHHFHAAGTGTYRVENGRQVSVAPVPGAGLPELRLFLLGSAWAALCYQRGLLPIHGSVIQVDGGAVAFCGPSGAGKSSTAAWLAERGFQLISDDLCIVDFSAAGTPCVWPSTGRLKLWDTALEALGRSSEGLQPDYFRTAKFHLPWPTANVRAAAKNGEAATVPLRAFYLLKWGEPGVPRLNGSAGLRKLIEGASYRGDLLEPMGRLAEHWDQWTRLAQAVPVWEFARPQDWNRMDEAMTILQENWK